MNRRKGFTFIEAILAISLVSISTMFRVAYEAEEVEQSKAHNFGKDLASIMTAIDRRVLLDGRADQTIDSVTGTVTKGDWTASWGSNDIFIEQMLLNELIGFNNSVCGDNTLGWRPKINDNDTKALVDCLIFSKGIPFNFEIRGEREPLDSDNKHIVSEWGFKIYNANNYDFDENFKFYPEILKAAKLYDTIRLTGSHQVTLVDRSTSPLIELNGLSECYAIKSNCAIVFKYKNSNTIVNASDNYVRVDGSVGMIDDLTFKTTAGSPEACYKYDKTPVSCGFDFNIKDGTVDLHSNKVNAETFHLISDEITGSPVEVMCDEGGLSDAKPCGISVIEDNSSVIAQAHFDKLYVRELFLDKFETDDSITIRKSIDDNDNYTMFSRSALTYKDSVYGDQTIEFGEKFRFIADDQAVKMRGDSLAVNAKDSDLNLKAAGVFEVKTTSGLGINSGTTSGVALTENQAIKGVRVVSIEERNSGEVFYKKSCPAVSGKVTPPIDVIAYPGFGHHTNMTRKGDTTCVVASSSFAQFKVDPPVITGYKNSYNGGGTVAPNDFRNADYFYATSRFNMSVKCDPQRDTAISYQVESFDTNRWKARAWFWGGPKASELTGSSSVMLTVMQYCDYGS
ncbi:type II secretion system protein [Vibrio crassostreae]|uniref:type II secretion system protein n=1 Tax=Vibrio crassostreae TaxID=246167 RepID=UPI001B3170F9|nr:type II secretion system protein [Vibrio crassostreae]